MYVIGSGQLVLNDFGSATDVITDSKAVARECTRIYASNRVLEQFDTATVNGWSPVKSDDYHAAIRSIFALSNPAAFGAIRDTSSSAELRRFWNGALSPSPWAAMVKAADLGDVDALIKLVDLVLPQFE
jgi:hypothetical protein